jgi:hypothetical protein
MNWSKVKQASGDNSGQVSVIILQITIITQ